jgi:hypothetical protein
MRVLTTGGRDFVDEKFTNLVLSKFMENHNWRPVIFVNGAANGSDRLVKAWAATRGLHTAQVPALWDYYQNSAGMIRNRVMLELDPDYLIAFPGGRGTNAMVSAFLKEFGKDRLMDFRWKAEHENSA